MFPKFLAYIAAILLFIPVALKAQYTAAVVATTVHSSYLVGSLAPDNTGNSNKLQVDVFGGGWGANNLGKTTYYIGNRGGITIMQTTIGSATSDFTVKAYANATTGNTDIYIIITADYPAIAINSFLLASGIAQTQAITQQTPVGTEITPTIIPVLITDQNGNISLNSTDSKGYKLAVNGGVIANAVTVKVYPWADFVFDMDYQLPSLTEVKTYIKENHHLSNIPSAAEIEKSGLNVGEMNKMLMQKVEELTLYLIEKDEKDTQQKQINLGQAAKLKSQQEQIDTLRQQIQLLLKKSEKN
jgi:hypothetical protein